MVEWLEVATEIVIQLHLKTIPHFTTLQKAAIRLSDILLHVAIGRFIKIISPGKIFAGADMKSQIICAVVIQHHPSSHDIKHFPKLFSQMFDVVAMQIMVLDKGYDAEPIHKMIRNENVISMIPTRNKSCLISRTQGRYRKMMRREFDSASIRTLYHQRNKTETIFSVIKRRFDSEIKSHNDVMKTKELLYRVLAYNCHRMCMISALLQMISR